MAGAGTSASALAVGGGNGPFLSATEEFSVGTGPVATASTLTTS